MKEFFLILLFSEWVQLTPVPVDVADELVLNPSEPISAITSGAALHVDLEVFLSGVSIEETGIKHSREIFEELRIASRGGVADYLEVLDSQRSLFDAELSETSAQRDQLLFLIQLYKSLGGGWRGATSPN